MGFHKKLFGSRKNEEEKVDEEFIDESIENKEEVNEEQTQVKNFKYLDNLIHSGVKEIVLDADIALDDGEESQYLDGIRLDVDDIVIDGADHTIDARGKTRIFQCSSNNIIIKNFTLKNAFTQDDGGAIKINTGNLSIGNCHFMDNKSDSRGSCLYCGPRTKIYISNSKFFNNQSDSSGCIHNFNANLEISDSKFYDNYVKTFASVIINHRMGILLIKNTVFKNNNSVRGGAILNFGKCEIFNSLFKNNSTSNDGGAINNQPKSFLNISNTNFIENECGGNGGAVINFSRANFDNVQFLRNSSKNLAGAISNQKKSSLTISNSAFAHNDVECEGGAIENWGQIYLKNSKFENNSSKGDGGALINKEFSLLNVSNVIFIGNECGGVGGAIYNYFKGNLTINESTFTDNYGLNGQAIENRGFINIYESKFLDNVKENGAIIVNKKYLKIFDCEIICKNQLNVVVNTDYLQIYNTVFKNNCAKQIISNQHNGTLGIFYGKFIDNVVEESVIFNNGKSCYINRTVFECNLNDHKNSRDIINQSELNLFNPKIKEEGKTIFNDDYISIKDSNPQNIENKIEGKGKVYAGVIPHGQRFDYGYLDKKIHNNDSKEIVLDENILFEKYEQDYYEGGIELDIDDLVIEGNGKTIDAANKSRIFVITGKNITLRNIIFENGYSHKNYDCPLNNSGAVLRVNSMTNVKIENCKFLENCCEGDGGAILSSGKLIST